MSTQVVWYDIEKDEIFESGYLDAMFFGLVGINWDKVEVIGEL